MLQRIRTLSRSRFLRNVAIVASGAAGAQAISLAFTPVITRLYGPEAFGLFGTFTATLAVLTPLAALSYPIAMVLPDKHADAVGLARLSMLLSVVMALLIAALLVLFGAEVTQALGLEAIQAYLWLLPIALVLIVLMQVCQQWVIRTKQFQVTARAAVLQALILNGAKVTAGWFYPAGGSLVMLATLGSGLHALLIWTGISRGSLPLTAGRDEAADLKTLARRYRDFPLYRAPQIVINAASQALPVLMLASLFGPAAAGLYSLGRLVMAMPSSLIGQAVFDVFYPRITEAARHRENLFTLLLKASLALAAAGVLPFGLVVLFGPWLFGLVFGAEWLTAGTYAQWLALWLFFAFVNRPSVAAIATLGKQGFFLVYEIVSLGLRAAALYVGFKLFNDDQIAVALFSAVGAGLNLYLIGKTLIMARKMDAERLTDQ
ncbi:Membrane protein involved in the export of O-antigen and teichoic acid [Halopseudomonas litoralis]|uniref:Membrane protein involved in the export of O-antigen and teichoic acid n=1 Tax=Halopseudomonas litoralis TaxID=797277 RepID=A0A1H1S5Y3_9GAMM|nr:lipopolysaccharide biosynthesis protein [Halopseudomonas litoralis]SDS43313.1 Membrane protein involved in the export of O-antigen and teichoic acid [Halopseudomonas litoralis]